MPPKRKKKPISEKFACDRVEGERFHAPTEEVFRFNWWEVFCFPYILCARLWDCCVSLCSGTNQCLVYWMMIQWLVCKITKITTPDPIIFPYYFYMFCQVIILTTIFVLIWVWMGKTVIIPFFQTFVIMFTEDVKQSPKNTTRLAFRRYCFRKGEIFETSFKNEAIGLKASPYFGVFVAFLEILLTEVLQH